MYRALMVFILCISFGVDSFAEDAITITYGSDYKPFSWGEKEVPHGVQTDFVEEILGKRMGINVNHEAYPWKRCQTYVRSGRKDGFFTVPTPARKEYTIISSVPFYETHFVLHTGRNNPNIKQLKTVTSLKDLEQMHEIKHVYMLGSGWHENALKNMKIVYEIPDASKVPLMLMTLRADVYIEQAEMFGYQAKELGVFDDVLTLNKPSIRKLGWHIFIGKKSKYQSLMPKINEMLKKLRMSGELEKIKMGIFKRHGIE